MRKLNIKLVALGFAVVGFATGCSKFLDINESPNQPTTTNVKLLLPSGIGATAHVLSNQFGINAGLWAQYWTQNPFSSQYRTNEQYNNQPSSTNNPWAVLYAGALQDYKKALEFSGKQTQHAAIANIMKAYTFQMITDAWDKVPLTGILNEGSSLSVAYQDQKQVYDSIFLWINRGLALIDPNSDFPVGEEDIVFQGDMEQWRRFANTLKLRAYLRLAYVAPDFARAGVESLRGAPFLTTSARVEYSQTGGNENPMFSEILGLGRTQNLIASNTFLNAMTRNNDPRKRALYTVVSNGNVQDTVVGNDQGDFVGAPDYDLSFPTALTGGLGSDNKSALAPVVLIGEAESYFLQAEALVRGWFITGSAQALFEEGIRASFRADNLTTDQADEYIANAEDAQWPAAEDRIKFIITQKYYSMNGWQTFEAWTEQRRTGFPDFFVPATYGLLGGDLPTRLPYPETEANTNGAFKDVGHKANNVRVWWDVTE